MKKTVKGIGVMLLAAIVLFSMVGCKKKEVKTEEKGTTPNVVVDKVDEPTDEVPANLNLLSGLPDLTDGAIGKRPVAIMVNNVMAAMPQYGIAKADIIYEIPVEGDVTRMMAIYADYTTIPQVCAIRSCRSYFPAFSQGYDAFYVNWGIDESISDYLDALNLDQYDGMNNPGGLFGRDEARLNAGYSLEHTAYFDGTKFAEVVQADGKRTELAEDKKETAFRFNGMEEQIKAVGADCNVVNINFGAATATLTYDEATKTYKKEINNTPQMDNTTNEQISFTNVFVLETSITVRDEIGHKDLDWDGGSDAVGYYISNGGVQKINWHKDSNNESSYLRFFDENGQEIMVNRGKSYIAVNYEGQATFQ